MNGLSPSTYTALALPSFVTKYIQPKLPIVVDIVTVVAGSVLLNPYVTQWVRMAMAGGLVGRYAVDWYRANGNDTAEKLIKIAMLAGIGCLISVGYYYLMQQHYFGPVAAVATLIVCVASQIFPDQ